MCIHLDNFDEHALITKAKAGDKQAFGELVRHHQKGVINVVFRMCGDSLLAEDVAQDAFVRAWQNLPRYQPRSAFRNWLYRIAVNRAVDKLRQERETVDVEKVLLRASGDSPEHMLEKSERAERVRLAVLSLPSSSRAVLVLREYEGLSYREIAEALAIPIGTVMSRLNYARTCLRKILTPYLGVL